LVIAGIVLGLLAVVPASAQTTPLQLKALKLDFTSYLCRPADPLVCDVTITSAARGTFGHGTVDYTGRAHLGGVRGLAVQHRG
jgi:hypothetical protein